LLQLMSSMPWCQLHWVHTSQSASKPSWSSS
jgi:hypothetical protein